MGQHCKPRHAKTITRDDLLHRLARAACMTYGEAWDFAGDHDLEWLRGKVEEAEAGWHRAPGRRQSFAKAQPTTSLEGLTR